MLDAFFEAKLDLRNVTATEAGICGAECGADTMRGQEDLRSVGGVTTPFWSLRAAGQESPHLTAVGRRLETKVVSHCFHSAAPDQYFHSARLIWEDLRFYSRSLF